MGEHRNLIIAVVVLMVFMLGYQAFVLDPIAQERQAAAETAAAADASAAGDDAPTADPADFGEAGLGEVSRDDAISATERVRIETEALSGSLALTGARFDDLQLLRYNTEVDSEDPVTLFNPQGTPGGHYAVNGWLGGSDAPSDLPGLSTPWRLVQGSVLSLNNPIVLEHSAGDLVFRRTISIDENYLFTLTDTVTNSGSTTQALRPYGLVRQEGVPADLENFFILHEGAIGVIGSEMFDRKYNGLEEDGLIEREGLGGWMGITSKYWLAAVAPAGQPELRGQFRVLDRPGPPVFESNYLSETISIAPGQVVESVSYVYAGAKSQPILAGYEQSAGIERLSWAIDWGMFWFMTQPFFLALHFFYGLLGNYGLAIMLLTLILKIVLFPLNNRAFASMAKMRAVTPKMTEIRERYKDDQQGQQKAMMDLYRKEKINPVAGCLPILPQIPIFFALYKTVFISLDARHAPFFGWITDMSAPDPTSMWNLFGLLPYDPSGVPLIGGVLAIGIWPVIMGITMWAQQSLNPPPPDKIQRQIFATLPIIFTIVMAPFPAALIIYWSWNNMLTVAQQYLIMRRQGVVTELDKNVLRLHAKIAGRAAPVFEDPYAPKPDAIADDSKAKSENAEVEADGEQVGEDGEDAPSKPKPVPSKRTSTNLAAKKRRPPSKKKPGK